MRKIPFASKQICVPPLAHCKRKLAPINIWKKHFIKRRFCHKIICKGLSKKIAEVKAWRCVIPKLSSSSSHCYAPCSHCTVSPPRVRGGDSRLENPKKERFSHKRTRNAASFRLKAAELRANKNSPKYIKPRFLGKFARLSQENSLSSLKPCFTNAKKSLLICSRSLGKAPNSAEIPSRKPGNAPNSTEICPRKSGNPPNVAEIHSRESGNTSNSAEIHSRKSGNISNVAATRPRASSRASHAGKLPSHACVGKAYIESHT